MSFAGTEEVFTGRHSAGLCSLDDPVALQFGHLGQHGQDQFAHTGGDEPKSVNLNGDAPLEEMAHRRLNVQGRMRPANSP